MNASKDNLTRRKFLHTAALISGGIALAACRLGKYSSSTAPSNLASSPSPQKETTEVVIVGAGISGLTAAYFLRDDNYDVVVFEAEEKAGGRACSGVFEGFSYAKGTEYLGNPEGALKKLIKNLNINIKEIPSPMDAHFHNNTFYIGEDALALMFIEESSLDEYNRFVNSIMNNYKEYEDIPEFDLESELAQLDQMSAREWFVKASFGTIYQEAYNVASRGLFGANIDEISALSYIPEIAFDYEDTLPILNVENLENETTKGKWATDSYTCETGITEITNAIASALGTDLRLNTWVNKIEQDNENFIVTYRDGNGQTHTLEAKYIVLAVPTPIALSIASSVLSTEQKNILEKIEYAPYVTTALFSDEPIFNKAFDLAVPDGFFFTDIYDSTWVQRYYTPSLRDKPSSIIGIYIAPHSYQEKDILNMSDENLLEAIYQDLEKIFPGVREKITGYDINRMPYAYPVMKPGSYELLTRLHQIPVNKLALAGDYMIYPTFEAAAESGYLAAAQIWNS